MVLQYFLLHVDNNGQIFLNHYLNIYNKMYIFDKLTHVAVDWQPIPGKIGKRQGGPGV